MNIESNSDFFDRMIFKNINFIKIFPIDPIQAYAKLNFLVLNCKIAFTYFL